MDGRNIDAVGHNQSRGCGPDARSRTKASLHSCRAPAPPIRQSRERRVVARRAAATDRPGVALWQERECDAAARLRGRERACRSRDRGGQQALRRSRSHRPSRRQVQPSDLFPVGRNAEGRPAEGLATVPRRWSSRDVNHGSPRLRAAVSPPPLRSSSPDLTTAAHRPAAVPDTYAVAGAKAFGSDSRDKHCWHPSPLGVRHPESAFGLRRECAASPVPALVEEQGVAHVDEALGDAAPTDATSRPMSSAKAHRNVASVAAHGAGWSSRRGAGPFSHGACCGLRGCGCRLQADSALAPGREPTEPA